MPIMNWDTSLSVNIPKIDTQHKKLVDLINKLYDAMSVGKGADVLREILMELVNYTKTHFDTEEVAMQKYTYPDYPLHKIEHDKFVKKARELVVAYNSGNTLITRDTLTFLKDWIVTHIKGTDQKYMKFFEGKVV